MDNAEHIEVPGRMNEDQFSPNDTETLAFVGEVENGKDKSVLQNTPTRSFLSFLEHAIYINAFLPHYRAGGIVRYYEPKPSFLLAELFIPLFEFALPIVGEPGMILLWSLITVSWSFGGSLVFLGALYGELHTQSPRWKTLYRGIQYTFSGFLGSAFLLMALNMTCNRLSGAPVDQKFHWLEQVLARVSPSNSLSSVSPSNSLVPVTSSTSLTTLVFGGWATYRLYRFAFGPAPAFQLGMLLVSSVISPFLYRHVTRWAPQLSAPRRATPSVSRWARVRAWFQRN